MVLMEQIVFLKGTPHFGRSSLSRKAEVIKVVSLCKMLEKQVSVPVRYKDKELLNVSFI